MRFPVDEPFRLSDLFDVPRPLDNPQRPHGAWDIVVPIGTPILAPEAGRVHWHFQIRRRADATHDLRWPDGPWYAYSNYWYDVFGGLAVLEGAELTHVFAHLHGAEVFERFRRIGASRAYFEDGAGYSWVNMQDRPTVKAGEEIGRSGNSGTSTGPHIHYEIHRGRAWVRWDLRPDPRRVYPVTYELKAG